MTPPDHPLWTDAVRVAELFAVDPIGFGGCRLRAGAGPVRDRWMSFLPRLFPDRPLVRVAAGTPEARLVGGLDLSATLETGRPVAETGLLARADGGLLVMALAERWSSPAARLVCAALDAGRIAVERDGLSLRVETRFAAVLLDEGRPDDEPIDAALADRIAWSVALDGIPIAAMNAAPDNDRVARARNLYAEIAFPATYDEIVCEAALAMGAGSSRMPLALRRAARASAALAGRASVDADDIAQALRLLLGLVISPPEASEPPEPAEDEAHAKDVDHDGGEEPDAADTPREGLVEAVRAVLPEGLLDTLQDRKPSRGAVSGGASGQYSKAGRRGPTIGVASRPPYPGARLDILATLRAAAPFQKLRRTTGAQAGRLAIRKSDFRYRRIEAPTGTTTVFLVDASGSSAAARLGEAKGAVELMLAECYVRRDLVSLVAFRGTAAEILLEPTRSLVRAKRCLSALPGGGGTPLASGLLSAWGIASAERRKGRSTATVVLTDGRANIGLDGGAGRGKAVEDALGIARRFRTDGLSMLAIDTGRMPQPEAIRLAEAAGGVCLALPRADGHAIAGAVARHFAAAR